MEDLKRTEDFTEKTYEEMKEIANKIMEKGNLDSEYFWDYKVEQDGSVLCIVPIYLDYQDCVEADEVIKILNSNGENGYIAEFKDLVDEIYLYDNNYAEEELDEIIDAVIMEIFKQAGIKWDDKNSINDLDIYDYVCCCFSRTVDYRHFFKQRFCVNLSLDGGDGEYDFSINTTIPPSYYSSPFNKDDDEFKELFPKSTIYWLLKAQGYDPYAVIDRFCDDNDSLKDNPFLNSIYRELNNITTGMATLSFLVNMSLIDILILKDLVAENKDEDNEDKYILIPKNVSCGLVDYWSGSGSILEIELDKEIEVPISFIYEAGVNGIRLDEDKSVYGIGEIYGMGKNA